MVLESIFNPGSYYFNVYAIPPMACAFVIFLIGVAILARNIKSRKNISFFFLTCLVFMWLCFYSLSYISKNGEIAFFFNKIGYSAVLLASSATYLFSLSWSDTSYSEGRIIAYLFLIVFGFLAALNLASDIIMKGVVMHSYGYYPYFNYLGKVTFFLWLVPMALCFINLVLILRRKEPEHIKEQAKTIMIGLLIGYAAVIDFIPTIFPYSRVYPIGYFPIYLFAVFLGRAIVRTRLMTEKTD